MVLKKRGVRNQNLIHALKVHLRKIRKGRNVKKLGKRNKRKSIRRKKSNKRRNAEEERRRKKEKWGEIP